MPDQLRERIRSLAQRTLKAAHRRLVNPDDPAFIESVGRRLAQTHAAGVVASIPDTAIERAVKFVFSLTLHDAFLRDGSAEQEMAFQSAQAYLFPLLLYALDGDRPAAEDLTQQALTQVWAAVRRRPLREPGAFSYFILKVGMNLVNRHYRKPRPTEDARPEDELQGDRSDEQVGSRLRTNGEGMGSVEVIFEASEEDHLLRERFPQIVRRCLEKRENYLRVIEAHFFGGHSFKELAQAWGCTATSLSVSKFRALEKLRRCPEMIRFVREVLLLSGGQVGEP